MEVYSIFFIKNIRSQIRTTTKPPCLLALLVFLIKLVNFKVSVVKVHCGNIGISGMNNRTYTDGNKWKLSIRPRDKIFATRFHLDNCSSREVPLNDRYVDSC